MITNKRLKCLGENQYRHRVPITGWRQPEQEQLERDCLECGEPHNRDSDWCSYYCKLMSKRAA